MGKKKLKKKLRLNGQSISGNSQTRANIAAQLNTVKAEYSNLQPVPEPQTSSAEIDEEWEDEDDSNAFVKDNNGASENVPAITAETNSDVNDNTVTQPETEAVPTANVTTQENQNMNVVNHPAVQAAQQAPQVAQVSQPAFTETNLVPEGAAEQMQRDAITAPPVNTTYQQVETQAVVQEEAPQISAAFHSIAMTVLFTLDLTNFGYMTGLKNKLSRVALEGQEFNLYSPFRKAGKKAEPNPAAEGIVRYALSGLLDLTDTINNSRVVFVGPQSDINVHLQKSIDTARKQIVNLFPSNFETVVAEIQNEEERQTIQLQLKDAVNVRSWINSSVEDAEEGEEAIAVHNAVINITVNAGMLYDTEDRIKYINQVAKILQLVVDNREESNTTLLLAVNMDSSSLSDQSMRELLDGLLSSEEFVLYTRQEMHRLDVSDFLPETVEAVDKELLSPNGDLLLIHLLTQDEDEAENEDASSDESEASE